MRRLVCLLLLLYLLLPQAALTPLPEVVSGLRAPIVPQAAGTSTFTPEQFGAVGDGSTDDCDAVQRALDKASSRRGRVVLAPRTTYLCNHALHLSSRTHLSGAGKDSVLKFTWTENTPTTDGYLLGNADQMTGNVDLVLDNFAILGAGSGRPSGPKVIRDYPRVPGIRLRLVRRFRITRLDIGRVAGISLLYQGSSEGVIARNHVHDSGRDGITGNWHGRNLSHVVVRDNLIERVGDDGIALVGSPGQRSNNSELPTDLVVRGNTILGWDGNPNGLLLGRGIVILASRRVLVQGNLVDRTHSYGILISGSTRQFSRDPSTGERWRSSDIAVVRNRVVDAAQNLPGSLPVAIISGGKDGIKVTSSDRVLVERNTIVSPYGERVVLDDCEECGSRDN